jgi:hypothetical protein
VETSIETHVPSTVSCLCVTAFARMKRTQLFKKAPRERFELPNPKETRFPVARNTRLCDLGL